MPLQSSVLSVVSDIPWGLGTFPPQIRGDLCNSTGAAIVVPSLINCMVHGGSEHRARTDLPGLAQFAHV